jgi:hypothetical protein
MIDNVASVPTKGSGDQDPEVRTPEARRAACMERLQALGAESEQLIMQKNALGIPTYGVGRRSLPRPPGIAVPVWLHGSHPPKCSPILGQVWQSP